jgi:hypothetical protein
MYLRNIIKLAQQIRVVLKALKIKLVFQVFTFQKENQYKINSVCFYNIGNTQRSLADFWTILESVLQRELLPLDHAACTVDIPWGGKSEIPSIATMGGGGGD